MMNISRHSTNSLPPTHRTEDPDMTTTEVVDWYYRPPSWAAFAASAQVFRNPRVTARQYRAAARRTSAAARKERAANR